MPRDTQERSMTGNSLQLEPIREALENVAVARDMDDETILAEFVDILPDSAT
jgi:hypothetical protein